MKAINGVSRRAFLGLGATAAAGAAAMGLIGCSPKADSKSSTTDSASGDTGDSTPSFLQKPETIPASDIKETVDVDIVIIGAGMSGMSATRSAIESGVAGEKIAVIEKGESFQVRSNQIASCGGQIQEALGIKVDKAAVTGSIMKECGYRPKMPIIKLWADNSAEALDWYLSASEGQYSTGTEGDPYDGTSMSVRKMHWPHPADANIENDWYDLYDVCQICLPTHAPYMKNVYDICVTGGVNFMFSTWARQLIREDGGRVTGVIVEDADGNYKQINAAKAVLLATGDYASNREMLEYYQPWATRYNSIFPNTDAKGEKTNTGDGQQMGMWIGAKMEDGPHAPMVHNMFGPLGCDAFLLVDIEGDRVMNEDVGGTYIQAQIARARENMLWRVWDSKWPEQIGHMDTGHGNVNWLVNSGSEVPNGSYGRSAYIALDESSEDGNTASYNSYFAEGTPTPNKQGVKCDTLEELAEKMGVDADKFAATIARYNELAHNGKDEDFGKRADRLFPIEEGPFFAFPITNCNILVTLGGLETTVDFEVLDTEDKVIDGLYAVGNTQGGRFLVDYPLPAPGASHGFALTHGMLVGRILAKL